MNRTNDNILDHDDDALLSEKHIRPFEFLKKLSESDSIRTCLVTANKNHTQPLGFYFLSACLQVLLYQVRIEGILLSVLNSDIAKKDQVLATRADELDLQGVGCGVLIAVFIRTFPQCVCLFVLAVVFVFGPACKIKRG